MIATLTKRLINKLSRKHYRDEYVAEHVRLGVSYQIRALREQRGWNQGKFAAELGKPQSVAHRLEDPEYGKLTVKSLLEIASAFDVALHVRFVDFEDFLRLNENVSPDALKVDSFDAAKLAASGNDTERDAIVNDRPILTEVTADKPIAPGTSEPQTWVTNNSPYVNEVTNIETQYLMSSDVLMGNVNYAGRLGAASAESFSVNIYPRNAAPTDNSAVPGLVINGNAVLQLRAAPPDPMTQLKSVIAEKDMAYQGLLSERVKLKAEAEYLRAQQHSRLDPFGSVSQPPSIPAFVIQQLNRA